MKKWCALMLMICLCACVISAQAEAKPMNGHVKGERIDVGFARPVEFLAGCAFPGGEGFVLVDTDSLGIYLLQHTADYEYDSICAAMPVLDRRGKISVTAEDAQHCVVTYELDGETHVYSFCVEFTEKEQDEWVLSRYQRKTKDSVCTTEFSFLRADVQETKNGSTENAVVYYQFFRQANNLNFEKHPGSVREALELQAQYPVAVVSPSDPTSRVNLREGPSTKKPICGSLYSGALLSIREMKDGWAKIHVGDTDAYISTQFLTFGAEIENVPDMRPTARIRDGEWVNVSRVPYWGGGGSLTQTRGGQEVRIMGEYNKQWRIVSANPGSYYVHVDDLK